MKHTKFVNQPVALLAMLLMCQITLAEERVLADDGREVLLKDDGSWEYISDDRFATTGSGERIRLKADGSWEIVTDGQHTIPGPGVVLADTGPAQWALQDVTIETARSQRGGSKKGVSKKTRTIFTLEFRGKPGARGTTAWTLDAQMFTVTDSGGRNYPVLSVEPSGLTLGAGKEQRVVVSADGSPHWFTTKFFELTIAAGAVDNSDAIRLKRALSNVRKREVEAFPE